MRIPQDPLALFDRDKPLAMEDLARLHELYRATFETIDRRLDRIHTIFNDANRWDNCMVILTSDHGQCFGEHGMYWHGVRTDEEMLRVPLWLRLPHGELGGTEGAGWASPLDAFATSLEAAEIEVSKTQSGFSLVQLATETRPSPLMAAGDGTEWNEPFCHRLAPARLAELNQFSIAVYADGRKVIVPLPEGPIRSFDVSIYPPQEERLGSDEIKVLGPILESARVAGRALLRSPIGQVNTEVEERLRGWGYQ
jgi:arylsulfatase A-like enzyme